MYEVEEKMPADEPSASEVPLLGEAELADYPPLLTPAVVASLLDISAQTVRRYFETGCLPGVKIGTRWYLPKRAFIEAFTESVR